MFRKSLVAILLLVSVSVFAQSRFEGALRGGASMLTYKSDFGKMQPSYNFGLDLLYTYRSANVVGFRVGASVDYSQSKFNMSGYQDSIHIAADYYTGNTLANATTSSVPVGNSAVDIEYTIGQVSEAHNQLYVSVPLQLGLHFGNFAIFMGPKIAFPMVANYRQDLTDVDLNVTYPEVGLPGVKVTVSGNEEIFDHNRESESRYTTVKGKMDSRMFKMGAINIFASVDVNYYIPISKTASFGIGLYCDYGLPLYKNSPTYNDDVQQNSLIWLNNLKDASTVSYTNTFTREHVSVLNAYNLRAGARDLENPQQALISKFNYISCGIRLSYQIGGERKETYKHQYHDKKICHCVFTN